MFAGAGTLAGEPTYPPPERTGALAGPMVSLWAMWLRHGPCGVWQLSLLSVWFVLQQDAPERRCRGTIRADAAEREVWQAVMQLLEHPDVVQVEVAKQQATIESQIVALDAALRDVAAKMAKIEQEDRRLVEAWRRWGLHACGAQGLSSGRHRKAHER